MITTTDLRRELADARARLAALRELRETIEALRSTPGAFSGKPIPLRSRNTYLDEHLARLVRDERELTITAGQIAARLVDAGAMP